MINTVTKVVRVRLRHDSRFTDWVTCINHASRYAYNRAVSEFLFDDDNDRDFGAYGMYNMLTGWRVDHEWLRDCPVTYARGAIVDASIACRRVIEDYSVNPPHRCNDGQVILSSVRPPGLVCPDLVRIPGYGEVETVTPVDPFLDMRSFRIVQGKAGRFELHIAVRVPVEPRCPTKVVRGVDVGWHHLAMIADTNGDTVIHNTVHKRLLREIDTLKGLRARCTKGGRRWSKLNKKIRRLLTKLKNTATNTINQTIAKVTKGTDKVAVKHPSIKGMTAHGGNHKRAMNRSLRENRVGEFLSKVKAKCAERNVELVEVPAHHTSTTCHVCGHVDSESRVTKDKFICTKCNREFHADVNAACLEHPAQGGWEGRPKESGGDGG